MRDAYRAFIGINISNGNLKKSTMSVSKIWLCIILMFIILSTPLSSFGKKRVSSMEFLRLLKTQTEIQDLEIVSPFSVLGSVSYFNLDNIYGNRKIENCVFINCQNFVLTVLGSLTFENCIFINREGPKRLNRIKFEYSKFSKGLHFIDCTTDTLRFDLEMSRCIVSDLLISNRLEFHEKQSEIHQSFSSNNSVYTGVIFIDGSFHPIDFRLENDSIFKSICANQLGSSQKLDKLEIKNTTFKGDISLDGLYCESPINITGCSFRGKVSLSGFHFDMERSNIDSDSLIKKIDFISDRIVDIGYQVLIEQDLLHRSAFKSYYNPYVILDTILSNKQVDVMQKVRNSYRLIISYLRAQNKKEEADYCYYIFKENEQSVLKKDWLSDRSNLTKFINFLLSYIHGLYSDYSTDFTLAVKNTIKIILGFTLVYFLHEIFFGERNTYKFYSYRGILRKKYYYSSRSSVTFNKLFISKKSKEVQGFRAFFNSLIRFFWGRIIRPLLISFITSLNFFVTLGYGGLQVKGKMRYFAVIEGLVGWFVLILFTSCLLNKYIDIN